MPMPSNTEREHCRKFAKFCFKVIKNECSNIKRAAGIRKGYDFTDEEPVEYLIELLSCEDTYTAEQLIDFGFIHCIDDTVDLHKVEKAGVIRYIEALKGQGVVRHIGLSSHTPSLANQVLDMGILDMLMFSINPGYDYRKGNYGIGDVEERMRLYRRCEKEGARKKGLFRHWQLCASGCERQVCLL